MNVEFMITDPKSGQNYFPAVQEGITWTTERRSNPGKLEFTIVRDEIIKFTEGSPVRLKMDGKPVFFGFAFTQKGSKDELVKITAYDQLRYLKNKDTYVYKNKTASDFIKMVGADFNLNLGSIADTGYKIPSRVEDNTSLFEMIENALDLTMQNTKQMFVLYDDFGKLTLKNLSDMRVGEQGAYFMIDEVTGENFEYTASIDNSTYNKIKLTYENESTGKRDVYIAQDSGHINEWGVLQYYDTLSKGENGQSKADALLKLYNQKTRNLKIQNAFGDPRVRAGSMIIVNLDLGDMKVKNFMLVEKATHTFKLDEHSMTLTLRGGEFIA